MNAPTPGLKPMTPGLRTVHYDAASAGKVNLIVPPGDVLVVSDDVADQLVASSAQFKDVDAAPSESATSTNAPADGYDVEVTVETPEATATVELTSPPAAKKATRKRAAKPKE